MCVTLEAVDIETSFGGTSGIVWVSRSFGYGQGPGQGHTNNIGYKLGQGYLKVDFQSASGSWTSG